MNRPIQTNEYACLIEKIKSRRKITIILTIIAIFITILLCSPMEFEVLGKTVIYYEGVSPILTVLIILAILIIELFAYAIVSTPLTTSMDIECDPQKHLILNNELNNQKDKSDIYAVDFFYMGNFEAARNYADNMIASNKPIIMITGVFNRARCEFFLGDFDSLKETVKQYENILKNTKKFGQKKKVIYEKIQKTLKLLVAISDKDQEKILEYRNIKAWNSSKATQGYIYYLKGIAAYNLNDKQEAIYRFMYVKENCEKTVFTQLAEQYLLNLNDGI